MLYADVAGILSESVETPVENNMNVIVNAFEAAGLTVSEKMT